MLLELLITFAFLKALCLGKSFSYFFLNIYKSAKTRGRVQLKWFSGKSAISCQLDTCYGSRCYYTPHWMSGPCRAYYTQLLKNNWLLSLHSMNNEHGERASAWFSMKELDFHNLLFLPRIVRLFSTSLQFLLVGLTIVFVARLIAITKSIPMHCNASNWFQIVV